MYRDQMSYDGKTRLIDVTSQNFIENPYKYYKNRRQSGDIIQIMENSYSVTGFEWGSSVLRSRDVGRLHDTDLYDPEIKAIHEANPVLKIISNWMLFHNPPSHTRLRKLVSNAFTPKMVAQLEDTMRELIRTRLQELPKDKPFNFITEIAYPFPVSVISEMMGIPSEDIHLFRKWSQDFAIALAMDVSSMPEPHRNKLNESARSLTAYFENLLEQKRDLVEEEKIVDLLTTMMVAKEEGDQLSTAELLSNATLLLVAGHETTTNLLGNGLHALIDNPHQMDILRSDYELIPNAVEEFLRYDAPVQSVGRSILESTEINGREFTRGEHISVAIGGCNRDPKVNPDPAKLDVTRDKPSHLSFSQGIHYCLGAPLARLEAKVAYEEILEYSPTISLDDKPEMGNNWLLRGFSNLPVSFT